MSNVYILTDPDGELRLPGDPPDKVAGRSVRPLAFLQAGGLIAFRSPEIATLVHLEVLPLWPEFGYRVFEAAGSGGWTTDGMCLRTSEPCMVRREIPQPELSIDHMAAWALCLAPHPETREFAVRWLGRRPDEPPPPALLWRPPSLDIRPPVDARLRAAEAAAFAAVNAGNCSDGAIYRTFSGMCAIAVRESARASEDKPRHESMLMPALARARSIRSGGFPAERYDEPYSEDEIKENLR